MDLKWPSCQRTVTWTMQVRWSNFSRCCWLLTEAKNCEMCTVYLRRGHFSKAKRHNSVWSLSMLRTINLKYYSSLSFKFNCTYKTIHTRYNLSVLAASLFMFHVLQLYSAVHVALYLVNVNLDCASLCIPKLHKWTVHDVSFTVIVISEIVLWRKILLGGSQPQIP